MSSRPRFEGRTREEGEAFYIDALEAWREAEGIDSYCLIGHSFGGYLAACWALSAPKLVRRLVLVGSAGMEQVNRACLGPNGTPWGLEGLALEGFNALWHAVQPQAIVRMAGPFGPGLASDYIRKKFGPHSAGGHLNADESVLLERYLFHCLAGGGKGAVANPPPHHALFFGPGAVCYAPLSERLDALDCPISFVYGLYDWCVHFVRLGQGPLGVATLTGCNAQDGLARRGARAAGAEPARHAEFGRERRSPFIPRKCRGLFGLAGALAGAPPAWRSPRGRARLRRAALLPRRAWRRR
jgi:pimeloyl-ACP methyl ester carboxylesterase